MNYIIFLSPHPRISDFLLLNIIENVLSFETKNTSTITLVCWKKKLIDNIYFKKEDFSTIINITGYKIFFKSIISINSDVSEKVIINISNSNWLKWGARFIQRKVKGRIYIPRSINKLKDQANYFKKKLVEITNCKNVDIDKPIEKVNLAELKNTAEYIDWTLESSGLRELSHLRYIHIIIKSNKLNELKRLMYLASDLISRKNNLKLILTLSEKHNSEIKRFISFFKVETRNKIIGREIWNYDSNLIINLIQKSKFIITDDEIYDYYCKTIDKECIYINKKAKKELNYNIKEYESKLKFALKNSLRS